MRQLRKLHVFSAQEPKRSRRFCEIYLQVLHTWSMSLCRPVDKGSLRFYFFSPGIRHSLRPKYAINAIQPKRKKKRNAPFGNGLTGAHRTRVQDFRIPPKERELPTRWKKIDSFTLNHPVWYSTMYHIHFFPEYILLFFLFRPPVFLALSDAGHARGPPAHHGAGLGPGRAPWNVIRVFRPTIIVPENTTGIFNTLAGFFSRGR